MMESADIICDKIFMFKIRCMSRCPTRQYANITGYAVYFVAKKNFRAFFLPRSDDNASDYKKKNKYRYNRLLNPLNNVLFQ